MTEKKPWNEFAEEFLRKDAEQLEVMLEDCLAKGRWPLEAVHGMILWRGNTVYKTTWVITCPLGTPKEP